MLFAGNSVLDFITGLNNEIIDLKKEKLKKLINLIDKDNIKLIQFFIESFKTRINHPEMINPLTLEKIKDENKDTAFLGKTNICQI